VNWASVAADRWREWIRSVALALVVWLLLRTFVVQAFHITSESMEGTLLVGDVLWVARPLYGAEVPFTDRRLPAIRELQAGDIVVFGSVETPGLEVVKRVVGVSGDTLAMRAGTLIRNGTPLDDPYVVRARPGQPDPPESREAIRRWQEPRLAGPHATPYQPDRNNWGPVVVPADSLFVMGDNRDFSWDGRFWGFLPRQNVHGGPLVIYYSFDPGSWRPLPLLTATRWGRLFTVPK
jgi:signal peptidase I